MCQNRNRDPPHPSEGGSGGGCPEGVKKNQFFFTFFIKKKSIFLMFITWYKLIAYSNRRIEVFNWTSIGPLRRGGLESIPIAIPIGMGGSELQSEGSELTSDWNNFLYPPGSILYPLEINFLPPRKSIFLITYEHPIEPLNR
jgi:hypothetical protein